MATAPCLILKKHQFAFFSFLQQSRSFISLGPNFVVPTPIGQCDPASFLPCHRPPPTSTHVAILITQLRLPYYPTKDGERSGSSIILSTKLHISL